MAYGIVQTIAPRITNHRSQVPDGHSAARWAMALCLIPAAIALLLNTNPGIVLIVGLLLFGILFAINSSLHSYLIVSYADREGASLDIGFYYTANAMGRLIGTLLSGWVFQAYGFSACLFISTLFIMIAVVISYCLPRKSLITS